MCGIFGTTIKYKEADIYDNKLETMRQRGPDFSKHIEINNKLVFGHNRLAIVDLDERSNQPFVYQHISIVFNGEVYNFLELKRELIELGYHFETTSDTEVVCAAYLAYGENCVNHFNGMFAFVIYDPTMEILFGARDRLGKKPFYYYLNDSGFEFASKLSAIEIGNELEIDYESLTRYLYWNYIPEPYSPYKKVHKLPSATCFTYDLNSSVFESRLYWDLPNENNVTYSDFQQAKTDLKGVLQDSVNIRMIADVPLGVFLSGGVDSSLIAAMAQHNSPKPIKTFSVKFSEKGFDESVYAKKVADILGTDHTEIQCSYEEGIDFIKNFSKYYDEPFADSSAIPTLLLSKYTKENVTVALSGDGGDETFLGYNIYDVVQKRKKIYQIPFALRSMIAVVLKYLPGIRFQIIARGLKLKNIREFYLYYFKTLNTKWILKKEHDPKYLSYLNNSKKNLLEAISDFDTKSYMNGDCITKVERGSMAFSLEVRSPLMDYRVLEIARKMPTNFKYGDDGNKKRILKEVLYDYLPKEIFERKKAGFSMPLGIWFKSTLKDFVMETFSNENLKLVEPLIDKREFMKIVEQHMNGQWDHTPRIWKMLVLINWLKRKDYA
ncbi:asparagine synthase (glutamine-hydrolyzing) [Pedobacter nyackensis]|uniref:asparagine synthase (glutamine-hydrolyzing) n=1 Tax=Pedobacter nyackensis TaxID=475255 RepID=A0A1W2C1U7_9SPHI|nr:asparagine synthase (glutamine-hydrolyzing) [Pedobacter nyackensis]SMC79159.1 asparagine synthase (glutamine-hydrolysing) [Pedobacter nyackensis]